MMSPVSDRPFHHGNLRSAILEEAERVLAQDGMDALSLRGLARSVGVSHSAPRRHFPDRDALLAAIAERTMTRLTATMRAALDAAADDPVQRFIGAGRAFVDQVQNAGALTELMFSVPPDASDGLTAANEAFAETVQQALGTPGRDPASKPARRDRMLVAAVLQGIATFTANRRIPMETADELIHDAARKFVGSGVDSRLDQLEGGQTVNSAR